MAIPETSREALQEAIAEFDRGERSPRWREARAGWMDNAAHKYAIRYGGRRYPVKEIIRLAIRAAGGQTWPQPWGPPPLLVSPVSLQLAGTAVMS
jgi:hypothetical protein